MKKCLSLCAALFLLGVLLTACDGDFQDNPLGYNFVGATLKPGTHRTMVIPPSQAKTIVRLRPYGIGLPPEAFVSQYGQPLTPSQAPTQFWFKATLDDFPAGSVMIVGFDRSSMDSAPRADEISYIAGDNHPTTDTQAETIAESFLPDDTAGPTIINKYDEKANTCQSEYYTSPTLATLFPAQDFLDATGKIAKPGTVTLSLFPYYDRGKDETTGNVTDHTHGVSTNPPSLPNDISSFLLTLGTKPYC